MKVSAIARAIANGFVSDGEATTAFGKLRIERRTVCGVNKILCLWYSYLIVTLNSGMPHFLAKLASGESPYWLSSLFLEPHYRIIGNCIPYI